VTGRAAGGVVVVGASTGGPGALRDLLRALPARPRAPIVVVQHMAEVFGEGFVRWLSSCVPCPVEEARPGERLRAGRVYVAARGPHVTFAGGPTLQMSWAPAGPHRPAIDELFRSAADVYGTRAMGVLLTGMGDDGAAGLGAIAAAGGLTAAQDEASCTVFGMPRAAIERGATRIAAPPATLARLIHEATEGGIDVE
jgi:two-component system chemotaxis response regulator CheB